MARVGGIVSVPSPVTIRETVSSFAVKFTFAVAIAGALGVKRTVTVWVAPSPTRVNGFPETRLKGAETDALPVTVPPLVFDTVQACSATPPTSTRPRLRGPVGPTAKSIRALAPAGAEQALSAPPTPTAVTETSQSVPARTPARPNALLWPNGGRAA